MTDKLFLGKWKNFPTYDHPAWDSMDDEEMIESTNEIIEEIQRIANSNDTDYMFSLLRFFDENKSDYMNIDDVYIESIESMPNYPPVELYTSKSKNDILIRMRTSCFIGGVLKYDKSINVLYEMINSFFSTEEFWQKDLSPFILETKIPNLNTHEVRLLLEIIELYKFEELGESKKSLIIAQIDNSVL